MSPHEQIDRDERPPVELAYYTDPLCPWSWAMEPHWRRLRFEFGGRIAWRYVMGGMVKDWRSYRDEINTVHRPSQMGPQCYQVRHLTGMPLDERIWHEDPPASSYPACLAVKAAARQGVEAGEAYLRRLRESIMLGRRNVARGEVLLSLAEEVAGEDRPGLAFDVARFADDLLGDHVRDAFQADLKETRAGDIARFPTLLLRGTEGPGIALVGYRPYEVMREALTRIAPDFQPIRAATDAAGYVAFWGRAAACEVAEALGIAREDALRLLEDEVAAGVLKRAEDLPGMFQVSDPTASVSTAERNLHEDR